jgi:nitrogen fixation protein FixH
MNPASTKTTRTLWPHVLIAWFVVFAAALAAWITFAVRQNLDLVRADYYEEEIRFQQQLDRLNRTAAIRGELALAYEASAHQITLRLPAAHAALRPVGRVQFYRPSNAALDFELPLAVDATGRQLIGTAALHPGQWKVRATWNAGGQDYFFEHTVILDETGADSSTVSAR